MCPYFREEDVPEPVCEGSFANFGWEGAWDDRPKSATAPLPAERVQVGGWPPMAQQGLHNSKTCRILVRSCPRQRLAKMSMRCLSNCSGCPAGPALKSMCECTDILVANQPSDLRNRQCFVGQMTPSEI